MTLTEIRIIAVSVDEYDNHNSSLFDKSIGELTKQEKIEIIRGIDYTYVKDNYELESDLKDILSKLPERTLKKVLKQHGYAPINKVDKVENITVNTNKFYNMQPGSNLLSTSTNFFNPLDTSCWYTKKALECDRFFAEITFGKNHPFEIERTKYKQKIKKKREKAAAKKKQKEIEKAKKILAEAGELDKEK